MTAAPTNGRPGRLHPVPASPAATPAPIASAVFPDDTTQSGDAVVTLRWAARRYAWLVLACVAVVGVLLPLQQLKQKEVFTAESLVVPADLTADVTVLPRYGAAIFDNGQFAQQVSQEFGDGGDAEDVVPRRVSVVTEQDSVVFRVQGHARDAQTAADLADVAADAFVTELNKAGSGIGTFFVQSPAVPPVESDEPLRAAPYAISVGLAAGLMVGLGALMLLIVLRRPVVDPAAANRATDLPVFGSVTLPRAWRDDRVPLDEVAGLAPLCRQLLDWTPEAVVLTGPDSIGADRHRLAQAICDAFEQVRHVALATGATTSGQRPADAAATEEAAADPTSGEHITVIDGAGSIDLVAPGPRTFVLLVVPVGIPMTRLRRLAGELRGVPAAIVLVSTRRRRRRRATSARPVTTSYGEEPDRVADVAPARPLPVAPVAAPEPEPAAEPPGPEPAAAVKLPPAPPPAPAPSTADLLAWVADEAARWFPRTAGAGASLQVLRTRQRRDCRIDEIALHVGDGVERLVVKTRAPDDGERRDPAPLRPSLAPPADTEEEAAEAEFLGLRSVYDSLAEHPGRGVSAVLPYGLNTDLAALAMEHAPYPSLHDVTRRPALPVSGGLDVSGAMVWSHAGTWLKRYHGLVVPREMPVLRGTRDDVLLDLSRLMSYLVPRVGLQGQLTRFCNEVTEAAEIFLGDALPTAVAHGAFDAQNVLVRPDGSVAVLAPTHRYKAPVFEDLCRMLVGARLTEPDTQRPDYRAERPRARFSETAFLSGYFGTGRVPVGPLRVFLALCTLDRWAEAVGRSPGTVRQQLRSFQVASVSRHYVRELRDQSRLLLPSSSGWSDTWV